MSLRRIREYTPEDSARQRHIQKRQDEDSESRFVEPKTLAEAEDRREDLVDRIQRIQQQLGDKDRRHPDGTRYTAQEFWEWRNRASGAQRILSSQLRTLTRWMKDQRRTRIYERSGLRRDDPISLISAAHAVLHRLACDGVDLDDEEQAVKDALNDFLQFGPVKS